MRLCCCGVCLLLPSDCSMLLGAAAALPLLLLIAVSEFNLARIESKNIVSNYSTISYLSYYHSVLVDGDNICTMVIHDCPINYGDHPFFDATNRIQRFVVPV